MNLCSLLAIDETNLAARRAFLRIGPEECALLTKLLPWAERVAPRLTHEFYDWQFTFPATRTFFEHMARAKGTSLESLRANLEQAQAGYFVGLFRGAREGYGLNYLEGRLHIGETHDRIDLPLKWYLGSYAEYARLIARELRAEIKKPEPREQALLVIQRVLNLDMQAVLDAYLLSVFRSMGLEVGSLPVPTGADRTESIGTIKQTYTGLLRELATGVQGLVSSTGSLTSVSSSLKEISTSVATAVEQLSSSIGETARTSAAANDATGTGLRLGKEAAEVVRRLGDSGQEIGQVVQLINKISGQTNLLALNATIEAARAGDSGKGFAVVAGEVKSLAGQTARATGEIGGRISSIHTEVESAVRSIGQVSEAVDQINSMQGSLAAAVEEQRVVVDSIGTSAHQSASAATQVQEASEEIARLTGKLEALLANFRREAHAR